MYTSVEESRSRLHLATERERAKNKSVCKLENFASSTLTYSASIRSSFQSNGFLVCRVQPHDPIVYTQLLAKVLHYLLLLFRSLWRWQPLLFPDSPSLRQLWCPLPQPNPPVDRIRTLRAVSTMFLDLALMTSTRVHRINEMFPRNKREREENIMEIVKDCFTNLMDSSRRKYKNKKVSFAFNYMTRSECPFHSLLHISHSFSHRGERFNITTTERSQRVHFVFIACNNPLVVCPGFGDGEISYATIILTRDYWNWQMRRPMKKREHGGAKTNFTSNSTSLFIFFGI